MAEKLLGYYNFNFTRSKRTGLSLRLALYETLDVAQNASIIRGQIEYKNTGARFSENEYFEYSANGNSTEWTRKVPFEQQTEWTPFDTGTVNLQTQKVGRCSHSQNGAGAFEVNCTFKTDEILIAGKSYYRTVATASASGTLTPINQSLPTIDRALMSINRYGMSAELSLKCSHAAYSLTASLMLKGMTQEQAVARNGLSYSAAGAAVRGYYRGRDGDSYKVEYVLTITGLSFDGTVPLYYAGDSPLESGRSYPYTLTVTAANSKSVTYNGVLAVPQKVTGIAFDDETLTLAVGESATPEYNISPGNAEVKTVSFESSDSDIATVSAAGVVTAVSEGSCTVTVISADHGRSGTDNYTSVIQVSVVAVSDGFPQLAEMDYLGVVEISRLSTACTWLADKLGKAAEMQDVVCQGRAHPVTDIRTIMEAIEANVAALSNRPAAEITKHNDNWHGLVNGWVNTLNELYELNKEG
mgnify:CR=1 FL=1